MLYPEGYATLPRCASYANYRRRYLVDTGQFWFLSPEVKKHTLWSRDVTFHGRGKSRAQKIGTAQHRTNVNQYVLSTWPQHLVEQRGVSLHDDKNSNPKYLHQLLTNKYKA